MVSSLPPDLQQGVLDVPRVHVKGGLPHHQRPPAEVLGVEAELLQQRQVGQQGGPLLRRGMKGDRVSRVCTMGV